MTGEQATSRVPRQARGAVTRQRVLEAAIESLAEQGWRGAAASAVAQRAGVSRGAAQHFFPTREALFTAAIEHVTAVRLAEIRERVTALPAANRSTRDIIEMLAELYRGPLFRAALHLWSAGSTDTEVHPHVVALEQQVGKQAHRAAVELLGVDETSPGARETVQGLLDLIRGLGLADVMTDDSPRRGTVLAHWAGIIDRELAPHRGFPSRVTRKPAKEPGEAGLRSGVALAVSPRGEQTR
ncbi:TetR/AcrR family transcriptional regulator [Amycolatopsis minnesotensis]|uniref:TetR/AcrR family transcriptional regulator n=1 Tax=Amycolatopsis minnesotensis TaxID=337894 RepID=A0ABN2SX20_9PSEU